MLDVRRLWILRTVASSGSFSAAADALSYTPSAIAQHIATLERETQTKLVDRGARGVSLTPSGEALAERADGILIALNRAEAELDAINELRSGRLRLASFATASATIVPPAISIFAARYPAVDLRLREAESDASVAGLRSGDLDLAVIFEYDLVPRHDWQDIERVTLFEEPMRLALPVEHPHAWDSSVSLADLADEAWIGGTRPQACSELLRRACRLAGFEPRIAYESDDYAAVQGLIAAGAAVALVPELALGSVRSGIAIKSLGPETPVRRVRAAVLTEEFRSQAATAMLAILRETSRAFEPAPFTAVPA